MMDELQDAIEDAHYMNAMTDSRPKPTKEIDWLSLESLVEFKDGALRKNSPHLLTRDGLLAHPIGFYQFMFYARQQGGPEAIAQVWFVKDVQRFKDARGNHEKLELANHIWNVWLKPSPPGTAAAVQRDDYLADPAKDGNLRYAPAATLDRSRVAKIALEPLVFGDPMAGLQPDSALAHALIDCQKILKQSGMEVGPMLEMPKAGAGAESKEDGEAGAGEDGGDAAGKDGNGGGKAGDSAVASSLEPISPAELPGGKRETTDDQEEKGDQLDGPSSDVYDLLQAAVMHDLIRKYWDEFLDSENYERFYQYLYFMRQDVEEDDFALFRVLGRGGFGLVSGCKRATTGHLYAMKTMNKKRIKIHHSEELCINERNVLAEVDSPFIVCLKCAFQTDEDLFLILDLMTGGDLGYHLTLKQRFTPMEAKYFAARTFLGLRHLHELNIVYRDLKPENILMDQQGRTRLSDLGLACKVTPNGLTGTCGTRGYWAPEMLRRDERGKKMRYHVSVDWFSFGCVVYEFLCGVSPFRTDRAKRWGGYERKDRDKAIDRAILEMEPAFVENAFDNPAKDFTLRLLDKNPYTRLGCENPTDIMEHPWFNEIDWDDIKTERAEPPFEPKRDINAMSQSEIGDFSWSKDTQKLELTDKDQETYKGWEFQNMSAFEAEIVEFGYAEEEYGELKPPEIPESTCCLIL